MLKQRFLVQFGSKLITQVLGMAAGIVVARVAGPSIVGVLAYGTAYVSILSFINGLFGAAHIKLVSEGRDHATCLAVYSRLREISSYVYLLATLGMFLAQKYLLHYQFESREAQIIILITLAATFIERYEGYGTTVYTANLKQAKANLPNFLRTVLWHLGRVLLVFLGFRAIALASLHLALAIFAAAYMLLLLREYPKGKYDRELAKEYFRYGAPALVIVIVNSITLYADKLLLAHYSNTTQLGYYSAAYSIGGMFMLIALPVGNIFFPLFSGMISRGDWQGVNENIRRYQEFIILFLLPVLCVLAIAGGPLLLLTLGRRYQPSVLPFTVLLFSTYVVLMGLPYGNIITGMGKFYLYAWTNMIKLVVFFGSVTLFVSPRLLNLGATGVACNQLVLNLTGNFIFLLFAIRIGKVKISARNNWRQLLIILFSAGAFVLSLAARKLHDLWWMAYIPLYLASIYCLLAALGLIKREHWKLLLEAVNLKKTIRYVHNEMRDGD